LSGFCPPPKIKSVISPGTTLVFWSFYPRWHDVQDGSTFCFVVGVIVVAVVVGAQPLIKLGSISAKGHGLPILKWYGMSS
jgi:hypothetical protein